MKYLKQFNLTSEYESYINGNPYLPNVSYIIESDGMMYKNVVNNPPYMCMTALEDDFTAQFSKSGLEYSLDALTWNTLQANNATPAIKSGENIYFRGSMIPTSSGIGTFSATKKFDLSGNSLSLLFNDDFEDKFDLTGYAYAFYKLFYACTTINSVSSDFLPATTLADSCYYTMFEDCTDLTSAPALPATKLANNCYNGMFSWCESLETAPELPATELAEGCYQEMFKGCSLVNAPALPATTLANRCYEGMFFGCTSLTGAPELPATRLADYCYYYMFRDCKRLTVAPELPATTLAKGCYNSMFSWCESLETAPELPATTLADECYKEMFSWCFKLNYIKMLATDISATNCLTSWVTDVASSGTFVKNANMNDLPTGASGIPRGWTVENA